MEDGLKTNTNDTIFTHIHSCCSTNERCQGGCGCGHKVRWSMLHHVVLVDSYKTLLAAVVPLLAHFGHPSLPLFPLVSCVPNHGHLPNMNSSSCWHSLLALPYPPGWCPHRRAGIPSHPPQIQPPEATERLLKLSFVDPQTHPLP